VNPQTTFAHTDCAGPSQDSPIAQYESAAFPCWSRPPHIPVSCNAQKSSLWEGSPKWAPGFLLYPEKLNWRKLLGPQRSKKVKKEKAQGETMCLVS